MKKACKAIIHVSVYINELEPTGEIGKYVDRALIKQLGLKNFVINIKAGSLDDCAKKVEEIFQKIKDIGN